MHMPASRAVVAVAGLALANTPVTVNRGMIAPNV
jgi:hypothetical protein